MRKLAQILAASLALAPLAAGAVELADGKLFINGNGGWSLQSTTRAESIYLQGDSDVDYHTAMFDLLTIARPSEDLTINVQMGFDGEEVGLEWAFLDWKRSDALRLRLGKVKQPVGNYAELQFVGTARPFYDLATAVYGPANIAAEAYQGAGLTGDLRFAGDWTFQYDLWGGAIFLPSYEPFDWFNGEKTVADGVPSIEEERVEHIVGARASVVSPGGLTFRLSAYGGNVQKDEEEPVEFYVAGLSGWYRDERLWLSAEGFYSDEVGFEQTLSGYLEAAWFLTEKVQLAGRYEISRSEVEGLSSGDPLVKHDAVTVGANYWLTPAAVLKASVDYVKGSRFILNEAWEDPAVATIERPVGELFRIVFGTQFTF